MTVKQMKSFVQEMLDREGEVIIRLILHFGLKISQNASLDFGCQIKQIKRLLHD